jgi:hypothetical protein
MLQCWMVQGQDYWAGERCLEKEQECYLEKEWECYLEKEGECYLEMEMELEALRLVEVEVKASRSAAVLLVVV